MAQDRRAEKAFVRRCGLDTAPYVDVSSVDELRGAPAELFPGILKVACLGYDGKGQAGVASIAQALEAFASFGGVACVLEKRLPLELEISVVIARGFDGRSVAYPVAENVHRAGILAVSTAPARISQELALRAIDATRRIADALDYVGVLCVEFFVLADGSGCVSTRWRRGRTTRAITPSTPASPVSSSSRRACSPACRSARAISIRRR